MAIISAFSKCLVPPAQGEVTPPEPVANKNWTPGHYIEIGVTGTSARAAQWSTPNNTSISTRGVYQRLQNDTLGRWAGVMLRYGWVELEGNTAGSYNAGLDNLDSYLEQIANFPGKKIMLFIAVKTFGSGSMSVPLYMRNSATYADGTNYTGSGNGQFAYASSIGGPGGYHPNFQVPAVADRFIALLDAIATRFNNHPRFEAIVISEAALAKPIGAPDSVTTFNNTSLYAKWFDGMGDALIAGKQSLSNIQISQWVNSPRNFMSEWVPRIRSAGIGIGMTDLCTEDVGFFYRDDLPSNNTYPGNVQHCQETDGLAIVTGHMSAPAMDGTSTGRCQEQQTIQNQPKVYPAYPGVAISRQASMDFAINTVKCSHVIWIHNTTNQPTTGMIDPNIPKPTANSPGCAQNPWTAYGNYGGQSHNKITDEFMQNPSSVITTRTSRPAGWT